MLTKYLTKFVLEALPSIVATVIGAYIVANYINPRPATGPKAAAVSAETAAKPADKGSSPDENAKSAGQASKDAGAGEQARRTDEEAAKTVETAPSVTVSKPAEKSERKDVAALARAAIERLRVHPAAPPRPAEPRGDAQTSASVQPSEANPARPPAVAPPGPPSTVAATPVPAAAAPPLPPPVIVAVPASISRPGRVDQRPDGAVEATGSAEPRLVPPADVPAAPPLNLQAQVDPAAGQTEQAPVEQVSIGDHLLSTTKAFFRALTPQH